jgi:hypothetical protein
MFRFTASLLVTAAVAQLVAVYSGWMPGPPVFSVVVNIFMVGLTTLVFRIVSAINDQQRFTQVYLATIVIKILAVCSFAAVLIVLDRDHARSNVVFLLLLYAIYTAIEVAFLVLAARSRRA